MKQGFTFYLFILLIIIPVFAGAQQWVKDSVVYKTDVYHVKKKSESIADIAKKLKVDPNLISSLNNFLSVDSILTPGQKIIVPTYNKVKSGSKRNSGTVVEATTTGGKEVVKTAPPVDTDLIQNRILLTDATLDLNRVLLQGIQASLDSLNVKDKNVIDEKNIPLTIHRMQRQRDKAMLTPVLLHMQDSLRNEISREENEKIRFESMLGKNETTVQSHDTAAQRVVAANDTVQARDTTLTTDVITGVKTDTVQVIEQKGHIEEPPAEVHVHHDTVSTSAIKPKRKVKPSAVEEAHVKPVIETAASSANTAVPAPIQHWETAKALYFNDDTTIRTQNAGGGDTSGYIPAGITEAHSRMSDSSRIIKARYFFTLSLKSTEEKNFKDAPGYLKNAIDLLPDYYDAWFALGEAEMHLGLYAKAMSEFKTCADMDSSKAELYYKMGVVQLRLKQKTDAFACFNKSLKLDSAYIPAIISRASEYVDMGQLKTAVKEYSKVIKIEPSYHSAYKLRAMVEYSQKNYSAAVDDFTTFLIFNEADADIYYYRGLARIRQKNVMDGCTDLSISAKLGYQPALKALQVDCK